MDEQEPRVESSTFTNAHTDAVQATAGDHDVDMRSIQRHSSIQPQNAKPVSGMEHLTPSQASEVRRPYGPLRPHTQDVVIDQETENASVAQPLHLQFSSSRHGHSTFDRMSSCFERAGLSAHDLSLRPWQTGVRPESTRIEKKIRMRVRYACHECSAALGRTRACLKCQHKQCSQCVRDPPRRVMKRLIRKRQQTPESSTFVDSASHRTTSRVGASKDAVPVP